jgi:Poly(ADP-ribose) polymerase catalytic domain
VEKELKQQRLGHLPVERLLFHGTREGLIAPICREGFNRSLSGKNGEKGLKPISPSDSESVLGVKYGDGSYFARDFQYSMGYAPEKKIMAVKVLTGEYGLGKEGMKVPTMTSGEKYHSLVDETDNPSIFVIFNDVSAYPAYIISYQ